MEISPNGQREYSLFFHQMFRPHYGPNYCNRGAFSINLYDLSRNCHIACSDVSLIPRRSEMGLGRCIPFIS